MKMPLKTKLKKKWQIWWCLIDYYILPFFLQFFLLHLEVLKDQNLPPKYHRSTGTRFMVNKPVQSLIQTFITINRTFGTKLDCREHITNWPTPQSSLHKSSSSSHPITTSLFTFYTWSCDIAFRATFFTTSWYVGVNIIINAENYYQTCKEGGGIKAL